ncbi:hypothetical protein [Jiangella muralis]|uniref:hypothetical protein n=1 Tax=Jiangella muralis TaxID=702383 RepID=UPI00069DABBC|nr:hypothetical protein [Jiangella muralis]
MTDDALKELFADAFLDEPDRLASPDEDIARGRARRARRRRARMSAGVVGVLAAGSFGILVAPELVDPQGELSAAGPGSLPYDELPPLVPPPWGQSVMETGAMTGSDSPASGPESSRLSSQPDRLGMVDAVFQSLPADVELADPAVVPLVRSHHVKVQVERDGVPFDLQVWWQLSSNDAQSFRPCSEPAAAFTRTAVWDDCTEGTDAQGRWRVIGTPDPGRRVLVVDEYPAAITLVWDAIAEDATPADPGAVLSDDEADRVAEAVRDTARDYSATLSGGINNTSEYMSDFAMAMVWRRWPEIEAVLTAVLGPLDRVRFDKSDPALPSDWGASEPMAMTASFRMAGGGTVELAVWQTGPIYGTLCTVKTVCEVWPGSRDYFRPLLDAPADARGGTAFGDLGQVYLVLDGIDGDAAALHRAAMEEIFMVLPMQY